jgi:hypothetical protein
VSDLTGTVRDSDWQGTFHDLLQGIYLWTSLQPQETTIEVLIEPSE